uniref:Uncharacterized protein n=1 Tax=Vitis vinifera TaxID=29760 RepID=A5C282_VITVI|nr:hypothetical protein VITISV_005295 [Vitis vinifera]
MANVVSLYEPLYVVLRLVDSKVVPTMPFVNELMQILNLLNLIIAYFLNPRFQYRHGVGSDPNLLQVVHDVFVKLDPTIESLDQLGNDLKLRNIETENDQVVEKDYIDLLDISAKMVGNPDPRITAYVQEFGVDVEHVLFKKVHSQSSRPNVAGTYTFGYNGSRTGIDDEGDIRKHQQCQYPGANIPMGLSGPCFELIYRVGMSCEGHISCRFTFVPKGVLVIMQGCTREFETFSKNHNALTNEFFLSKRHERKRGRIEPDARWYRRWTKFILLRAVYSSFFTPMEFGFFRGLPKDLVFLDIAGQIAFLIDIVLQFFLAYRDTHTYRMVYKRTSIALRIVKLIAVELYCAYTAACIFYYLATTLPQSEEGYTWIGNLKLGDYTYSHFREIDIWKRYTTSLYFASVNNGHSW